MFSIRSSTSEYGIRGGLIPPLTTNVNEEEEMYICKCKFETPSQQGMIDHMKGCAEMKKSEEAFVQYGNKVFNEFMSKIPIAAPAEKVLGIKLP